jgi:hypothetical protein
MGAEGDGSFSTEEVRATAHRYHTEPEIFSGMGHDMMLEPGWADVAERIHNWLNANRVAIYSCPPPNART